MGSDSYDFIVVGSGPAGSAVASRLAKTTKAPKVLLLEAGGENSDKNLRVDGQRWTKFMDPELNWGYLTVPQKDCNDRVINYSRGRGLGGSSAINFGIYTVGARGDYDQWAKIVGDDHFKWDNIQERFKSLESFHGDVRKEYTKYTGAKTSDHGKDGGLHLGFAQEWEKDVPHLIDLFEEAGFPMNPDHNSGNPIGMALSINSSYRGRRSTAADLLVDHPLNLTIITNSPVQKLIIKDKTVVGVESNEQEYFASKEIILSAGSLDTPKILMHSGIGPAAELEKHNIKVIENIPAIGQNLRDHVAVGLIYLRKENINDRGAFFGDQERMNVAIKQWNQDSTGPWSVFGCEGGIGWFKSDKVYASPEFKALPASEQEYMHEETVPHYEIYTHFPAHMLDPTMPTNLDYNCFLIFLMNEQSRGEVTLQSSDPKDPLLMDPKLLSHPFDRRAAIETIRHLLDFTKHPAYAKDTAAELHGPKSESDEDLLQFWKDNLISTFHMTGTVKMGKHGDADAAVDSAFRVRGVQNLRVADMSVVPVLTNNHTQATAYVTGASCADKLVEEYGLA